MAFPLRFFVLHREVPRMGRRLDARFCLFGEDDDVIVVSKPAGLVTHPGRGHEAGTLVNENGFTAWRANDGYWYFHPQRNYRVKHAAQIYRESPDSRSWGIEWPGKSKLKLENCLACCEAYGADPNFVAQ